jgi:hypothetical protein
MVVMIPASVDYARCRPGRDIRRRRRPSDRLGGLFVTVILVVGEGEPIGVAFFLIRVLVARAGAGRPKRLHDLDRRCPRALFWDLHDPNRGGPDTPVQSAKESR